MYVFLKHVKLPQTIIFAMFLYNFLTKFQQALYYLTLKISCYKQYTININTLPFYVT